jgi:hypothetical protein
MEKRELLCSCGCVAVRVHGERCELRGARGVSPEGADADGDGGPVFALKPLDAKRVRLQCRGCGDTLEVTRCGAGWTTAGFYPGRPPSETLH